MGILDQYGSEYSASPNPNGPSSPDLRELGSVGTVDYSGFDLTEQNPALQGQRGLDNYAAMGHDPTVAMTFKAYEMPQRSCDWYIDAADESPQAVEIADFIHYNLWEFRTQSFDEIIRQCTTGRNQMGFALFEQCWGIGDEDDKYPGKVMLDKLAWRRQQTIYKWNIEEIDMPDGSRVRKLVSITQWAPPYYHYTVIPADKLAIFSRDSNGENYLGQPLSRAMYKPWWIRDRLYTIQSVGLERSYMGYPIGKLPLQYTAQEKALMTSIVTNFRTHERAGAVMPENMSVDTLNLKLEGPAMQAAIDFHTHQIPLSALAQFTLLGSGQTGSFALSHDQSDLFLMCLNGDANYTAQVMNGEKVIPQLIEWNYPNIPRAMMPKLKHGDMGQRDMDKLLRGIAALAQWGVFVPDDPLEDALRKEIGLPERDGTVTPEYLHSLLVEVNHHNEDELVHGLPRPPAPGAHQPAPGAASMSEYRDARARAPWRRPTERTAGKLSGADRVQAKLSEQLLEMMEGGRKECGKVPERPSIRAAKNRKPYQVHMSEKDKVVVTKPEQVAIRHKKALKGFLAARASAGPKSGHVPLPKGPLKYPL